MKATRYIFIILFQVMCFLGFSQERNIRFEHIGTDNGLSQSNVLCILQDSRGFMWFGTRDGLNKYDGYKFTIYKNDANNKNSLSDNYVPDIFESSKGNIWIATRGGGLSSYDREKEQFINYKHDPQSKNSISSNLVLTVFEDSYGNVWAGTEDAGLNLFDTKNNKFTSYTFNRNDTSTIGDNYIKDIFEDSRRNLWIATNSGGLNLFDRKTKTFRHFLHDENNRRSISGNSVWRIFEDSKQRLWIGTNGAGLNLFNRETGEFSHFKHEESNANSLAGDVVYAIVEDNSGNIWIGTENSGLSIFNPAEKKFTNYITDEFDNTSLSNNSIYSICKDTKSNIWLGTFNSGLNKVNRDAARFIHHKHIPFKNSLSHNKVWCIYEDSKSGIWISTDGGGLNLFDPKTATFIAYRHEPGNKNSISGDYVLSVREDQKGNIWAGTWGEGVNVFNKEKNTFRHFKNDPANKSSLSNNNVWVVFEDRDKNMWIGTHGGGLNLFNPDNNSFSNYQHDETDPLSLSNNNVQSIFEDSEGYLWIGTDGGGLNRFDKNKKIFSHFIHEDKKNSISNNSVGAVYEDGNGMLWISTMVGLNSLDRKTNTFTVYTTKEGLPNNTVFGILEDEKKNLWISTNKGISKFNLLTKTFKNFGISDGLQSNEFKGQAFCKSRYGTMYFGGNNGFNEFSPYNIKDVSFDPPLVITDFQIFNKKVPIAINAKDPSPLKKNISETKAIAISYKSSVISFEFASLNYASAEKKQYAYMLEGFDNTWNEVGMQHTATYTNLDPGEYVFKVKGLNNDGSWSNAITSLQLTITPPFWLTWWFKAIAGFFIIGSLIAVYRFRINAITRQKERLQRKVKERTDQVERQKEEMRRSMIELETAQVQMSQNVTELALLKENLEKEKYLLDSLMDNMPDAIYFKDKESKITRVSKYMADHFGTTVNELIGKSDFDFQDETHAREAYEDEQEIQRTKKPKIDYIEKELKEDRSEHWVSTTKMPLINGHGEVVGTFGMSRDITKIKQLEQEQHAAVLEKAVAQGKFEIASDVMHDIGNAVVGFGSYLSQIRRLQSEDNPANLQNLADFFEKQQSAMDAAIGKTKTDALVKMLSSMAQTQKSSQEEINKSIVAQLNIVTNIHEILNIQRQYINGHESQERKTINLKDTINDSISMVLASIDKMGIDVSSNIAPDLPLIKGDRTKLMQLTLNMLKNSIEAIDRNAEEKTISICAHTKGNQFIIQVKDNGHGFDKSIRNQLLNRGFSTKSSASGLGLYNCQIIAESHEGTVEIDSEGPGKGAVTTVTLKIC